MTQKQDMKAEMTSNGSDIGLEPSKYRDLRTLIIGAVTVGVMGLTGMFSNNKDDAAVQNNAQQQNKIENTRNAQPSLTQQ